MNGYGNSKSKLLWTWLNNNNGYGDLLDNGQNGKIGVSKTLIE
jgi:hypothetical protein